jgi:hypothetical protein
MSAPPISTRVRVDEQVPVDERKRAPVRLSAQAVMTEDGAVVAAVATPPAMIAPATNALMTLAGVFTLMFLILTIFYLDAEISLCLY